ncbi:MAG: hypothetical protein QNJ62_10965 [Methyloceanibacter sp.]|nr:hypothetical protein [Methyloceanibacter sp.]
MRRPHRTIETFDISLMAVVTKAMGAFLVLMLLLLPYYTPDSTEDDAAELLRQLQLLDAKLDEVHEQLGDPSKTVEELRQELDEITATTTLRAEVLAKLRGLINKAFSEIRQLEAEVALLKDENAVLTAKIEELEAIIDPLKAEIARLEAENAKLLAEIEPLRAENEQLKQENAALIAENEELRAEVAALLARIALLEEELRRLQKNQPREQYQGVMASYDVRNCNDVQIKGTILRSEKEEGYTFDSDGAEMGADYLLQANFGMDGGAVPKQEPIAQTTGAIGVRTTLPNAGMVTDQAIGAGDYIIVLVKRDTRKTYKANEKTWVFLSGSRRSCTASIAAAARAAFVDDWASNTSISWTFPAKKIAGIPLALTSDDQGIQFRPPKKEEEEWLDRLVKLALETQDDIPEIKKAREEAERKAREAEEKKRKEAEERRKRLEEERRNAPVSTHLSPEQLINFRRMLSRFQNFPKQSPARRGMEKIVVEAKERLERQIKESEAQLQTLPSGPKQTRTKQYLTELRKVETELNAALNEKDGGAGKKNDKDKDRSPTRGDNRSAPDDGALAATYVTPRDLQSFGTMERMYKRAAEGSAQRKSLENRITDARRRVGMQIQETQAMLRTLPPGPLREQTEAFLSELRKFEQGP